MNEASFQIELQGVFLGEAEEILEQAEDTIIELEKNPFDSPKIDKMFRLIHTLKGSAYIAGFADLGSFSHIYEALLDAMRAKKIGISEKTIDILLSSNDCLKRMIDILRQGIETPSDLHEKIQKTTSELNNCLGVEEKATLPVSDNTNLGENERQQIEEVSQEPQMTPQGKKILRVEGVSGSQKTKFLVVDDEEDIVEILCLFLESLGVEAVRAYDGAEALGIFKSSGIDVIFTDLRMPNLNGIEFVREVRKLNEFIPVVFISGQSNREHFKDFLALGVLNFIDKPFEQADVTAVTAQVLKQVQLQKALLAISKLSFKAYVSIERILAVVPTSILGLEDRTVLYSLIDQIQEQTNLLVGAEQLLKAS